MCSTPTLFRHLSLFAINGRRALSLSKIALSGECLSKESACIIRKAFPTSKIYNVYGLTECSPRVCYLEPTQFDLIPESVGVPVLGVEIKILDEHLNELKYNEHGYIYVKSKSLMQGYYNNSELTHNVIIDGWLKTGDIGYKDEKGYLYVLSRADDMINKGGMNIYPSEIENKLMELEQIKECLAYGYKKNDTESIGLYVVLDSRYSLMTLKDIKAIISAALPRYLMPTQISIVDTLKKNASGKKIRKSHNVND